MQEKLTAFVLETLNSHADGISEYELLKSLQKNEIEGFPNVPLTEQLPLFQMHFRLYHALYQLREALWQSKQAHLMINPLCIMLQPYQQGQAGLAEHDALRDYYLDLNNLEKMTKDNVAELLGQFWTKVYANENRTKALTILQLQDPVDYATIKQQYRRLAMQHHPDRGGDKQRLQALNWAKEELDKFYQRFQQVTD